MATAAAHSPDFIYFFCQIILFFFIRAGEKVWGRGFCPFGANLLGFRGAYLGFDIQRICREGMIIFVVVVMGYLILFEGTQFFGGEDDLLFGFLIYCM